MYFKILLIFIGGILWNNSTEAQLFDTEKAFTHSDTLRGNYGPTRDWWDVLKYDLYTNFHLNGNSISGQNIIQFKALKAGGNVMQIDLQEPMVIDSIYVRSNVKFPNSKFGTTTKYKLSGKRIEKYINAYTLYLPDTLQAGNIHYLYIYFHGQPRIAKKAPWDGGLVVAKDKNNNPWISVACQGLGASVWYPCKDHQKDEPDSAEIHISCPKDLVAVSNGRLRSTVINDSTTTYTWAVVNPINNYNIIPYIGKYVNFSEVYAGEKGALDMSYWVLEENLEKAKEHFKDAAKTMKAFEYWFGPFPFYEDSYKLVDAPYLGMEHQSAIAYGNKYEKGYMGYDLSHTDWGLKWDFIIVHESGHEWFGNNITTQDIADMWIHEGFTNYSEALFVDYYYGTKAGNEYAIGLRKNVENDKPIIGAYNVNNEGSGDMYYKAANMLHTIRQVIGNDSLFRNILRGLNKDYFHKTVTTKEIENYISVKSGFNYSKIFDQYLRTIQIPTLEYKTKNNSIYYRYTNCVKGFNLPIKLLYKKPIWIYPGEQWKKLPANKSEKDIFPVDVNFYVNTKKVS